MEDDLKLIFASNLIRFRQEKGMTQLELAQKISYSDKSVSKWERGESVPDIFVLKRLSELFGVTVDEMITDHFAWKQEEQPLQKKQEYSQLFIILCSLAGIVTACFVEFVLVWSIVDKLHWVVLIAAVPLSLIALLILNSVWYHGKNNMYIVMALVLSLVLLCYYILLRTEHNLWHLLLLIGPAELIVYLAFHIRPRRKSRKTAKNKELSSR